MRRALSLITLIILFTALARAQSWTYQGNSSCFRSGDSVQCFDQGTLQSYATDQHAFDSAYQNGQALGQGVALLVQVWLQHHHELEIQRSDLREQIKSYYAATYSLNDEITDDLQSEVETLEMLSRIDPSRSTSYEELRQSSETLIAHISQMKPMTEKNLPGILAAKDIKYLTSNRDLAQKFYSQAGEASKRQFVFSQFLRGYTGLLQSQQATSNANISPRTTPTLASSNLAARAEAGDAAAQYELGEMFRKGVGVQRDIQQGAKLIESAAASGYNKAEFSLGEMYESGEGELQNFVVAHAWFNLASLHGIQEAQERRDTLASRMTPEQISDAQKLAAQLQSKISEQKQAPTNAIGESGPNTFAQAESAPGIQQANVLSSRVVTESTGTTVTHNPACDNPQTAFMKGFCSTAGTQVHDNTRSYIQVLAVIGNKKYTLVGDKMPPPGVYDVHFISSTELDLTGKAANGELHSHRFKVMAIDAAQE